MVAGCLAKDPTQRPTPGMLLDRFTPESAGEAHTPTRPVPAVQSVPRGARRSGWARCAVLLRIAADGDRRSSSPSGRGWRRECEDRCRCPAHRGPWPGARAEAGATRVPRRRSDGRPGRGRGCGLRRRRIQQLESAVPHGKVQARPPSTLVGARTGSRRGRSSDPPRNSMTPRTGRTRKTSAPPTPEPRRPVRSRAEHAWPVRAAQELHAAAARHGHGRDHNERGDGRCAAQGDPDRRSERRVQLRNGIVPVLRNEDGVRLGRRKHGGLRRVQAAQLADQAAAEVSRIRDDMRKPIGG